ncbi:putative ABC transport system permease protein [Saccharothrix coeruleofusca]|uniref:ABC transporter permease n=1 Tax=Saccharothrix coeruleofusca TaxID=33919 RepID=UPI001AE2E903|nr:FtsX-like permease family protein [Saccharothrix coeruleofusca]MBP2337232.1 putative ABC transport system permease protein [Saccharothrix coeruleofusca]
MRFLVLASRLARREMAAQRSSSLLVLILITLPVLGITAYLTADASAIASPESRIARELGGADVRVLVEAPEPFAEGVARSRADITTEFGPDSQVAALVKVSSTTRAGDREVPTTIHLHDTASPLTEPLYRLLSGKRPASADEVALSEATARRLAVSVGDRVTVAGVDRPLVVSGVQFDPRDIEAAFAVLPDSGELVGPLTAEREASPTLSWLVKIGPQAPPPGTVGTLTVVNKRMVLLESQPSNRSLFFGVFLGSLLEITLIVAAVFATTARRQRRFYALLALSGAGPRQRFGIACAHGLVIGVIAAAIGVAGGVLAALLLRGTLEQATKTRWEQLTVPTGLLGQVVLLAVAATVLSAALVSRSSATRNPAEALHGRESVIGRSRRGLILVGGGLLAVGVTSMVFGLLVRRETFAPLGVLLGVFGGGLLLTVLLPRLLVVGRGMRLPARLAIRDTALAPSRTAALATAIASMIAVATTMTFYLTGMAANPDYKPYVPDAPENAAVFTTRAPVAPDVLGRAAEQLGAPGAIAFREAALSVPEGATPSPVQISSAALGAFSPLTAVVAEDEADELLGRPLSDAERRAFTTGSALALNPGLVSDGSVLLKGSLPRTPGNASTPPTFTEVDVRMPALVVADRKFRRAPLLLVTEQVARARNLEPLSQSYSYLFRSSALPSEAAEDQARATLLEGAEGRVLSGKLLVERGDSRPRVVNLINRLIVPLLVVFCLVIIAMGIGLSTNQLKDDFAVLAAVGAQPGIVRAVASWQAGATAAIGVVFGVAIGGAGAVAMVAGSEARWTVLPLGLTVAAAAAVVLLAAALGRATASRRLPTPRWT